AWQPAGVTAIDPDTGAASIWSKDGAWIVPTTTVLVVGGRGLGLTGFAPDGTPSWHAAGTSSVYPYAVGATLFVPKPVKRHTIVTAYSLATGRTLGSRFQTGNGMRPFSGVTQPIG
ncbi:MAG TPA: hypothetical protein VGK92_10565, partial [Gaiellales bacterium]